MKDRQVEQSPAALRVPVASTVLHCISMTVIVFLRSGFGYAYFRPKSIFVAFAWAFILFSAYAWLEPGKWSANAAVCLYGIAVIVLYLLHFMWSFASELRGNATHDNDSGTPHTLRILSLLGKPVSPTGRNIWVIWIEPAAVLAIALVIQFVSSARNLSAWLILAACSLWLKESLNYWLQLRQRKRHKDTLDDAKEGLGSDLRAQELPALAISRTEKTRRQRMN